MAQSTPGAPIHVVGPMKISRSMSWALAGACAVVGVAYADEIGDGHFEMPRDVVSAATAFEDYMQTAARIDRGFSSGEGVARALQAASAYEPRQLEEGMIAYGALVALQDEAFVDGVERAAGRGEQRRWFADRLLEDPDGAMRIEGAPGAGREVDAALATEAAPLVSAGAHVKVAAYSVQHQSWSKVLVANAGGRLSEVKRLSSERSEPQEADERAMLARIASLHSREPDGGSASAGAVEARALALAAEAVLGQAHASDRAQLSPLLTEASSAECLKMAKLNLYQCMAVAGPQYEDIYCMGQHAMYDTGQCVAAAAHGSAAGSATYASLPRSRANTHLAAHHARVDPRRGLSGRERHSRSHRVRGRSGDERV
jgi:hypothetical protein